MDIFNTLNSVTHAADTVYEFATFDWDKKSLISLAVATTALVGITAILAKMNSTKKQPENPNEDTQATQPQ